MILTCGWLLLLVTNYTADVRWFQGAHKKHSVEQEFSAAIFLKVFLMEKG
jgi:hypothetical protein